MYMYIYIWRFLFCTFKGTYDKTRHHGKVRKRKLFRGHPETGFGTTVQNRSHHIYLFKCFHSGPRIVEKAEKLFSPQSGPRALPTGAPEPPKAMFRQSKANWTFKGTQSRGSKANWTSKGL